MSPREYFTEDDATSILDDLSSEERAKIWELHRKYFLTILRTCPFKISKVAYDWIVMASLDI